MVLIWVRIALLLSIVWPLDGQVAEPVMPCYDRSKHPSFFKKPQIPNNVSLLELTKRGAVSYHDFACITNAANAAHSFNRVFGGLNETELRADNNFLTNATYWVNDYLHVGHIHYDIVLLQVLAISKVDRIIHQRAACHGILCAGIGTIDSFYKGYYAAAFDAFNQPDIPVYVRWTWHEKVVKPLYFTSKTEDNYNLEIIKKHPEKGNGIRLTNSMCFERFIRKTELDYGSVPTVSPDAVMRFKEAAYKLVKKADPPLTTYFVDGPPYKILFSHRGAKATRRIANQDSFVAKIIKAFPEPDYIFKTLNNSDPMLDYQTQLQAVAEAHIVVTNHGAFEGNMIYMRNGSLLLEIFGHYGNNEIHTFHRLALMFGVYYSRAQPKGLTDHYALDYNMTEPEMEHIVDIMKGYFKEKPYLHNLKPEY